MDKLLIVDDEKWIRLGIEKKIATFFPGKFQIYTAKDATEALQCIRSEAIDILITDIRMPGLGGIDLVATAQREYPGLHSIIISGYADFSYAEQALNMGVASYILKPVQDDALREIIEKALSRMEKNREEKALQQDVHQMEEARRHIKMERQLNQVFAQDGRDVYELSEDIAQAFPPDDYYVLLLINIDYTTYGRSGEAPFLYRDTELIRYAIRNIIAECAQRYHFGSAVTFDNLKNENQVYMLTGGKDPALLKEENDRFLLRICEALEKKLKISTTIGQSDAIQGVSPLLSRQVKDCIALRLIYGIDRFYKYSDIPQDSRKHYPTDKLALLKKSMERRDFKNIELLLRNVFNPQNFPTVFHAKLLYSDVVNSLLAICVETGINADTLIDSQVLSAEVFNTCDTLEEVAVQLYAVIWKTLNNEDFVFVKGSGFNARVLDYIEHNYLKNLTTKTMAEQFAISPNYFSSLFSKNNGTTFTQYLLELRIRKAASLLEDADAPIDQIAESVGFNDTRYFYRIFKRIMAMTPSEYRAQHTSGPQ